MAAKTKSLINTALVLVTAAALLINCTGASSSKIIVSPDHKKHTLINASLALVIQDEKPKVIYHGSVRKALGTGDTETLVRQFFQRGLLSGLSEEVDVNEVFMPSFIPKYLVTKEVVDHADEAVTVEIPMNGTKLELSSARTDLVLFLSGIRIGTETDQYYHSRVDHGINVRVGRHLIYISSFVLWDNRTQNFISYGRVKSRVPIRGEEAVISEWEEVSKQFIRAIFEPAGFLKRTKRR